VRDLGPIIGLVSVIMLFGIPIVAIVAHHLYEAWKAWLDVGLKRDMVARGYTAQEIIEVLAAEKGTKQKSQLPNVPPAKPVKQPAYSP